MALEPDSNSTPAQRQAIGSLCYDAGICVNMDYTSSASGSDTLKAKDALTTTFGYSNGVKGYNGGDNIGTGLNGMVNPNLDWAHPVMLGITGTSGGHAVIADGYGYNLSTLYHHINMGWRGSDDAWYNLPDIDSSPSFTSVYKCVYNIFVSGSGEIISGRIVDVNQEPISGATVTVQGPGDPNSAITNAEGIYALAKLASASTYTIAVSRDGYTFGPPKPVTTGVSGGSTSGNRWAVDFEGTVGHYPVIQTIPDQVEFSVMASDPDPEPQILSVRNSGFGTLHWVADCNCNWLEVDPCEGISTGDINAVTLRVDTIGMALGSYNCQLTLSDPCAFNNPKTVQANLSIWDVLRVPTEQYPTIQAAVDAAADGCIIVVSEGTYTGPGNRDIDFLGKAITIRSEDPNDLSIVGVTIIDCDGTPGQPHRGFFLHSGEGESSILDGLTIVNGYAPDDDGGGIFCVGASPTIRNCTISGCRAGNIGSGRYNYGGGVSNKDGSCPTLINCTFTGNSAQYGGGMHNRFSNPTIINCTFTDNLAQYAGAMYNYESNPMVTSCAFNGNQAYYAGAIYVRAGSDAMVTNCTFTNNFGDSKGGGIYNKGVATLANCTFTNNTGEFRGGGMNNEGTASLTNCTFSGNAASASNGNGGGISTLGGSSTLKNCLFIGNSASFYGAGVYCQSANHTMVNCTFAENSVGRHGKALATSSACQVQLTNGILWDGGDEIHEIAGFEPSTITVQYSDIQGGWGGTGNINSDPCFVTGPEGDYYLSQIAAGQAVDSPCLDAGSDLAENLGMDVYTTRTNQFRDAGMVDMGYHYEVALGSGDVDENWHVDLKDYAFLAADWLQCISPCDVNYLAGDITRNGCVDVNDLAYMMDCWLHCYMGTADNPYPQDNTIGADPNGLLNWSAAEGTLYHDVYLGTDADAVAQADIWSPEEYMGTVSDANFDPCGLERETHYYWRIDEVGPACTAKGLVWDFTTAAEPNLSRGLVSHWKFDEGSETTAYDSAGDNHGTIYGAQWTTGQIGGALDFDGDDGVYVEPSAGVGSPLNIYNADLTISAWARIRGEGRSIVARAKELYITYKLGTFAGVSAYSAHINTYKQGPGHWILHTDEILSPDTWYHLVGVFDRSTGTGYVYVNGAEEAQGTIGANPLSNDATTKIGCRNSTGDQAFDGSIDDVRIYNRALNAEEIQQLYQE
jgi:hypothetical protein